MAGPIKQGRWLAGWLLCAMALLARAAPPLPALGAEPAYTVSGLSSGGFMAAQYALVFSREVTGLGVVAGGPYDCSLGSLHQASTRCSCTTPPLCSAPTPSVLSFQTRLRASGKAAVGLVDPLDGLKSQRVWLFSGGLDETVPAPVVEALKGFYLDQIRLPPAQLKHLHRDDAGHGLPVLQAPGAVACGVSARPFLMLCGVDAAGELLAWLHPGTMSAAPVSADRLLEFDQTPYEGGRESSGLGSTGYVYVPEACSAAGAHCRVHVVFHGCRQARDYDDGSGTPVGSGFAEYAGYNRWAAGSRMIVLYPQVRPTDGGNPLVAYQYNPRGCWDFWGYTRRLPSTGLYASNAAPQMLAVQAMVKALQRRP